MHFFVSDLILISLVIKVGDFINLFIDLPEKSGK